MIITSTQATATQYTVKLKFPGQQGTPGKLSVRVQLLPKELSAAVRVGQAEPTRTSTLMAVRSSIAR